MECEINYACPVCKLPLSSMVNGSLCQQCRRIYPVKMKTGSGIRDFVVEDLTKSTVLGFDALAKIYETPFWYPLIYHFCGGLFIPSVNEEIKMITEMVDAQGGVGLDVGCGTGLFTRSIAQQMRLVHGIDISMGMLEKATDYAREKEIENICFARADAERLPFPDSVFDGVVCCGTIHLLPDTVVALREMARVMKKGARLAVMTFVKRRFLRFKWIYEHLREDLGLYIFDVEELDDYLSQAGFKKFDYNIHGSMILFRAEKS